MTITTIPGREFDQDTKRAKLATAQGPVFITDGNEPAHVLLSIQDYRRLGGNTGSILDALGDPAAAEIEFDPPRAVIGLRPATFD